MSEFLEEQARGLAEMAEGLRKSQLAAARKAAMRSAARIRSLNMRAREMAKSGVRLANLSHGTLQRLIGLHEEIVTAALADAAAQIEKLAYTDSVRDFGREQAKVMAAARERIVNDVSRGMSILREAAAEARATTAPARRRTKAVRKAPAKRKAAKGGASAKRKAPAKRKAAARKARRR
ncbi:MAG: hypothetical protein U1F09_09820 [Steroidobacteraceae bacterium]